MIQEDVVDEATQTETIELDTEMRVVGREAG